MYKNLFFLFILIQMPIWSQSFQFAGKVLDENGFKIESAEISLNEGKYWTTSDVQGNFTFRNLPKGTYHMDVYFLGYEKYHDDIHLTHHITDRLIVLKPSTESLTEVEIHVSSAVQRQKEASLSVELVNAQYIQRNLKGSLMKSLEELPGVSTIDVGSGQSKPVIRGLSFNQVVVVENGIKHEGQQWGEDHGLEMDPYAVKQIEIIKGPSSLLYGSDAIGGIILINNASYPFEEGIKGNLDFNTKTYNAFYGGSLNLTSRKNEFYTDNRLTFNDYADYKVPTDSVNIYSYKAALHDKRLRNTAGQDWAAHSQLGWVNEHHHTRFYISYYNSNNAFFANAHGLEPRFVDTDLHDSSNRDIQEPRQTAQHFKFVFNSTLYKDNNKWDVEMGYQKNYRQEFSPYVNHGYMPATFPDDLEFASNLERLYNKDIFSANVKYETKLTQLVWNWGINSEYQKNQISGWSFIIPEFSKWALGGYVYAKYDINDKTNINSGLRYDYGSISTSKYFDWFPSNVNESNPEYLQRSQELQKKYHSWSWAIGLSRNTTHFDLKINIGRSFRMPIAKEIASNGVNYHHFSYEIGNSQLKPETSYQWDLGLEWHYEKWAFQMSPFVNYFPNYIYLNPTSDYDYLYGAGNQIYRYTDAQVVRFGSEWHGHYTINEHWKADLIAEYVYAEQLSGSKKGSGLPFAPPGNIITKMTYKFKVFKTIKNSNVTLAHKYTLAQNKIVPPEEKTRASSVWDFLAETEVKVGEQVWDVNLQLNNVLNTRFFSHTNYYRIIGVPESGRNLSLSVKIPF